MAFFSVRSGPAILAVLSLMVMLPSSAGSASAAEAPRVLAADVKKMAEKGEAVIVDVRGKDSYDQEHAEGAISIPLSELEGRLAELPKNKLVAAYCT